MTTATLHSATPLSHLALFRSFSARLSERQRAALSKLAAGRPIHAAAAAAAAGVHRSTLHGWLSHCEDFQAAYAAHCRRQSDADSDLAALARASLQALITDPATSADLRLRAIQTALKLVQSRPATPLLPALERPPDAPLPAVARLSRGSSPSGGGRAEEGSRPFQSPDRQRAETATPRNAPCPCGSKLKFKRCCGMNAPPVLHAAAP